MGCLFKVGEDTSNHIKAEGIIHNVGFHPGRLNGHKPEVVEMLSLLPSQFKTSANGGGGGWSFLNACMDKNGNQWTGDHQTIEQLFQLGIALGLVKFQAPRELWPVLPGGMPYVSVDVL